MTHLPDRPRISRLFRLQWEEVQNSHVLLYPEGMITLNQSAGEILQRCDGLRNIAAIVNELELAFSAEGLLADVEEFLGIALQRGWIA
ncbi:MAG TPA: pyrroloquinoline quinone biosynthesis peptide chaperone PqqD [Burkholderiaceae bacterium]|jgi:pyrroloquinoline quinone biosynthesis protein D